MAGGLASVSVVGASRAHGRGPHHCVWGAGRAPGTPTGARPGPCVGTAGSVTTPDAQRQGLATCRHSPLASLLALKLQDGAWCSWGLMEPPPHKLPLAAPVQRSASRPQGGHPWRGARGPVAGRSRGPRAWLRLWFCPLRPPAAEAGRALGASGFLRGARVLARTTGAETHRRRHRVEHPRGSARLTVAEKRFKRDGGFANSGCVSVLGLSRAHGRRASEFLGRDKGTRCTDPPWPAGQTPS